MILSLVGRSGAGKTTALLQWAAYLRDRGYRLGLAKHSHHPPHPHQEGKDSQRLALRFPEWVVLANPEGIQVEGDLEPARPDEAWTDYLVRQSGSVDVVLVEGGTSTSFAKMEVVRGGPPRLSRQSVLVRIGEELELGDPRGWTRFLVEQRLLKVKSVLPEILADRLELAWHPCDWHSQVPWLTYDRLLGFDPESRLVVGHLGLYLGGSVYPFGSSCLETPLPRRGLPACWSPAVREGYWRVAELASTGRGCLAQSLRRCSRQYALDRRDPRDGLGRLCEEWLSLAVDSPAFLLQTREDRALLKATREWLSQGA